MSFPTDLQRKRTYVPSCVGRSLLMVQPQGAETFSPNSQPVEIAVHGCPHVVHRNAWTPLRKGGTIVDMGALLAVFAAANALSAPPMLDPQHLPRLPDRGLVHTTAAGVELETLQGRRLGLLRRLHVAQTLGAHGGLLQDRRGNFFAIDRYERRVRRVYRMSVTAPSGCTFTDAGAR